MQKILILFLSLLALTGCATLSSALPTIESAVTDTTLVLKTIDTAFGVSQAVRPLPAADVAEYETLLGNAYKTLTVAERAVTDLKQVNQAQYDQAFSDFRAAFETLTAWLRVNGIPTPATAGAATSHAVGVAPAPPAAFLVPRVIGLRIQ